MTVLTAIWKHWYDNPAKQPDSIHIDTSPCRADIERTANALRRCEGVRHRFHQKSVRRCHSSLLDCIDSNLETLVQKIYDKITRTAKELVPTGAAIEKEFGIPVVNKRISVTPIALVGAAAAKSPEDFVEIAKTLDAAAKEVGVNFIGGFHNLGKIYHKIPCPFRLNKLRVKCGASYQKYLPSALNREKPSEMLYLS